VTECYTWHVTKTIDILYYKFKKQNRHVSFTFDSMGNTKMTSQGL